ncbi:MAG: transposase [Vicinamibacterales bacterium]
MSLGLSASTLGTMPRRSIGARFLPELPARLIGDRGYDSDPLDALLRGGIEMIAAHRRGRSRLPTQDGRPLRRRRRWMIQRLFAWLHNSRRLVTRWEYHVENFLGMLQLACARILLRHL